MNKKTCIMIGIIDVCLIFLCFGADISVFPADSVQDQIIEHKKYKNNVILLDVRTDMEVEEGIIASENCKPYHLTWNSDEWSLRYADLPKDILIIIYCRTGHRAMQAAQALVTNDYSMIAIMEGGIEEYKGRPLADSTSFKFWSELPQPSYFYASNTKNKKNGQNVRKITIVQQIKTRRFNLMGQEVIISNEGYNTPGFLLEQTGTVKKTKITGMHHLIQVD